MKKIFAVLFILAAFAGCGGKEGRCHSCPTEPTVCTFISIEPSFANYTSAGGTGTFRVNKSAAECASCTNVTTNDSWIHIISVGSIVEYRVDPGSTAVEGKIVACGFEFRIKRDGSQTCTYTAVPPSGTFNSCKAGEVLEFAIITQAGCPINPQSLAPWLEVIPCATCNSVKVRAREDNNTGSPRTGVVKVAEGCEIRITQPPCPPTPSCSFVVQPTSRNFSCPGGTATFTVTTQSHCSWFAETSTPWITITSGSNWTSGSGSGTISVPTNGSSSRSGSLTIAGQAVTITQDACTTQFSCTRTGSASIPVTETVSCPNGGTQSATVTVTGSATRTSDSSCQDAQNQADAAAQTDANSKVPAAREEARRQALARCPSCTFSVPPNTETFACESGNGSIVVSSTCPWTASTSTPGMITITGGSSGSGNGSVRFTVSPNNTGASRVGNVIISVAGQTRTVSIPQNACATSSCTFTVPPSTQPVSSTGTSNGSIIISGTPGCQWSASAPPSDTFIFLTGVTSGTFGSSGSASVQFTVAGNSGAARTGHINTTVAGVTKTTNIPQSAYPN